MMLCEKCGRVIQAYEVKYRLEVDGKRRTFCNEDAKELLKGAEKPAAPKAKPPVPAPAAGSSAQTGSASATAPAPPPPKPAMTPEELEARKKAALEKAAAMKAAKAAEQAQQG